MTRRTTMAKPGSRMPAEDLGRGHPGGGNDGNHRGAAPGGCGREGAQRRAEPVEVPVPPRSMYPWGWDPPGKRERVTVPWKGEESAARRSLGPAWMRFGKERLRAGARYLSSLQWPPEGSVGGDLGVTFAELAMDFELASGHDLPAAERQVVAATTGSATPSNEPAPTQKLEGNAEPVGADDKHRLEWREGEGRWVCVRCARSCKGRDAGGKNRLMAKTCAGRVETRAEAIARTKLSQGAAARAAARETAGGDVAKARRVDMADKRSAARTTVVGARKANGDAGASAAMESAKRPIADRARAFGDLVRAVGRQGACQPFLGERTEVCRALVPLGLPYMAGPTRRPVFMAAKHTEAALKGMVTALGGSWRKVIGPAAKSGGARKGPGWGDSVEPVYGARPRMPLWEDAKEPAGSGPSEGSVAEAPGLDADEKKHTQQQKQKQNNT